MKQNAILTDIKDAVQNADLVCFDIFDTLITRKVLHPVDAFLLTEELAKARSVWNGDFKNQRIRAEQMAYEQVPGGHVTLKDIYAVISAEQQLSVTQTEEMMNLELESEGLLTVPRTDVREEAVWDRLLNGCLDYSLTLAEDIFASMVVCDLLPEEMLSSLKLDDPYKGYSGLHYNKKARQWESNLAAIPFAYSEPGYRLPVKLRLKNFVKAHAPMRLYETFRLIWVKYIK